MQQRVGVSDGGSLVPVGRKFGVATTVCRCNVGPGFGGSIAHSSILAWGYLKFLLQPLPMHLSSTQPSSVNLPPRMTSISHYGI